MTQTIHERAMGSYRVAKILAEDRPKAWAKAKRRAMAEAVAHGYRYEDDRPEVVRRDYRAWVPGWNDTLPLMTGSGRAVQWCHIAYLHYACIAETLHRDLGWRGDRVRRTAKVLASWGNLGASAPPERLPLRALVRVAALPEAYYDANVLAPRNETPRDGRTAEEHRTIQEWALWMNRVANPAWGRRELGRQVTFLRANPEERASGMAAGLIRTLRGEPQGSDYRHCSGCEWLEALAGCPDLWDFFLERQGTPRPCTYNGVEAIEVTFGMAYPAEFDYGVVLGLGGEIRVRKAEYEAARAKANPSQRFLP